MENRHDQTFRVIEIPRVITEEDRGQGVECCESFQVLADAESNDSWKNDTTLHYVIAETASFVLKKDGEETEYTPPVLEFPNDINALYTQIDWQAVLLSDGTGEYILEKHSIISGIEFIIPAGNYTLSQYGCYETRGTVRLKSVFNNYIDKLGIDFTGTNAVHTVRLRGEIVENQPNFQIENDQFTNDLMFNTRREDLMTYKLVSVPVGEMIVDVVRLQLLAENEFYISDYNSTAFSYSWLDLPVIVDKEGGGMKLPAPGGSRLRKIECLFGDKTRNQKAQYK